MPYFDDIAAAIAANSEALRSTGALAARPGRALDGDGYPTDRRVIVVIFAAGSRPVDPVPAIGGFPIDPREVNAVHEAFLCDPQAGLARAAVSAQELVPSPFPGQIIFSTCASPVMPDARSARETLAYTPPDNANLDPLPIANVKMICSVSPDNGWNVLQAFLTGTQSALTVAMYDWTSAHIEQTAAGVLVGKTFDLVLDDPVKNATADQTDLQTVAQLKTALGTTFRQTWALTPRDPDHGTPIFESAYHIKVAVRDTGTANSAIWLSSGNWNNSNQPIFDPAAPDLSVAKSSDRDWHIVIFNDRLATTFKAYIDHDFLIAAQQNAVGAGTASTAEPLPLPAAATTPGFTTFVKETTIEGETTITPLLTPDPGIYVDRITALFQAAQTSIDLQYQYITSFAGSSDASFAGMIDALARAQARGVAIRMIYSEFQQAAILELLKEAGLAIDREHVRIQNNVHNKGILIDGHITVVSSQNWSGAGVLRNRDAGLIIDNADVNAYYLARCNYDWETLATGTPAKTSNAAVG